MSQPPSCRDASFPPIRPRLPRTCSRLASAFAAFAAFLTWEGSCRAPRSSARHRVRPERLSIQLRDKRLSRGSFERRQSGMRAATLRAIGRNPQLEPAAVRKLDDFRAGEGALYCEIGKSHVGTNGRRTRRIPTNLPTILLDANGRSGTPTDASFGAKLLILSGFWTNLDVSERQNGAQERTRTFTACTAGT